jgi:5-methylcytosine-specific restriction endonuclease McrA
MEGKVCTKCKEWKVFGEFNKRKRMKDGHRSECRKCVREYNQDNKDKIAERDKKYHQANKEKRNNYSIEYSRLNKDKITEYKKKYNQENVEKIKEYQQEYHKTYQETNKEKGLQRSKEHYQKNKEKYAERSKKYCQTERGKSVSYRSRLKRRSYKHKVIFTPIERKQILDRDNWECKNCGIKVHDRRTGEWNTPDKAHIDHVVPISKGGNSEPKNLRVLCRTCNLSKSDKQDEQLRLFI